MLLAHIPFLPPVLGCSKPLDYRLLRLARSMLVLLGSVAPKYHHNCSDAYSQSTLNLRMSLQMMTPASSERQGPLCPPCMYLTHLLYYVLSFLLDLPGRVRLSSCCCSCSPVSSTPISLQSPGVEGHLIVSTSASSVTTHRCGTPAGQIT